MQRRLDNWRTRTSVVTISGATDDDPELDQIVVHIRSHGMIAADFERYYFTPDRIKRLNDAGLDISNQHRQRGAGRSGLVKACGAGQETALPGRARGLSHQHQFIIAAASSNRRCAHVAKRAELGFSTTVGVIHDGDGTLKPLTETEKQILLGKKLGNKSRSAQLVSG